MVPFRVAGRVWLRTVVVLFTSYFRSITERTSDAGKWPLHIEFTQWRTEGGFRVFKPPPSPPKFRIFYKAEPNSQFRGKYIRNNLTRIRLSLIFWVVSWKALPASYDPHSVIFFSLQGLTWRKHKVPKIKKILPYEMKFLVPNYSCLQNPWLGVYRPQIPVLSVLCPQLNLLNPLPPKKIPGYATGRESS